MKTLICNILFLFIFFHGMAQITNAPLFVGRPPQNAYTGLVLLENGEIRHYGDKVYIRSVDQGKTWDTVSVNNGNLYGKQSPVSKEFIRLFSGKNDSVFSIRSVGGIDGAWQQRLIDTNGGIMLKPAIFVKEGKRAIVGFHTRHRDGCGTYYSDDNGKSWTKSNQVQVPNHQSGGFHKGVRWNHGAVEPTIVELKDGKLWMLIRTAQDQHWESFSSDLGETWSKPVPSRFYGTITMPTLHRLKNGNLLFIWSNTTPLPELENTRGIWEDVFTNRDAIHVAISEDDGVTWHGYREIYLNPLRNDTLMATRFGKQGSLDRSVHQSECVEPEENQLLISLGQHPNFRALIKLDANWLLEKERTDDFSNGLNNWSLQKYIKGVQGHCAYNRKAGAILIPHPDNINANVLHLKANKDTVLLNPYSGACFNFPAGNDGEILFRARINENFEGVQVNLIDRWFNPTDTVAKFYSMFDFDIPENLEINKHTKLDLNIWYTFKLKWSHSNKKDSGKLELFIDHKKVDEYHLRLRTQNGINYIHFLLPLKNKNDGILIESIHAKIK